MKLENQVTNLELSKQLKELGVKQESLWYWGKFEKPYDEWHLTQRPNEYGYTPCVEFYSAFTVAELGEMLKNKDEYKYFLYGYHLPKRDCFDLVLETSDRKEILHETRAITEANARAKMLIYLKKENLLTR